jgi:hypothetical protein
MAVHSRYRSLSPRLSARLAPFKGALLTFHLSFPPQHAAALSYQERERYKPLQSSSAG